MLKAALTIDILPKCAVHIAALRNLSWSCGGINGLMGD
jgi:hypothetical protein